MNNRVSEVRKHYGLTQEKFGERLGLSRNYVWMIEKGDRIPADRTISDICRVFNVSEPWLRTGEGEMFKELSREQEISVFVSEALADESDSFRKRFLAMLCKLDTKEWEVLEKMAIELADK